MELPTISSISESQEDANIEKNILFKNKYIFCFAFRYRKIQTMSSLKIKRLTHV